MRVTKSVRAESLKGIVALPPDVGDIVTITVTDYNAPKKADKEAMQAAMRRIETGIEPSDKTFEEFRSERLANEEETIAAMRDADEGRTIGPFTTITELTEALDTPAKESTPITDKFAGIASNLDLKAEDVRCERLEEEIWEAKNVRNHAG